MKALLFLLLFTLIMPMSPLGLEALSDLTGLKVTSGHYEYLEEGTVVRAEGEKNGVIYRIWGLWQLGRPTVIRWEERGKKI